MTGDFLNKPSLDENIILKNKINEIAFRKKKEKNERYHLQFTNSKNQKKKNRFQVYRKVLLQFITFHKKFKCKINISHETDRKFNYISLLKK